jgi:hypothetical protein
MNYKIIKQQYSEPVIEIRVLEDIDFRNDSKLMKKLKKFKNANYTFPHPLEWLPDNIKYINFCNIFSIDFKDKQVYILDNLNEIEDIRIYSNNNELLASMKKYKKIVCNANICLDWLPDGITHLEINNQMFNNPLDNLPQSLIYLGICGGTQIFEERYFNQSLDNLPNGLKCLYLANLETKIPLDNLPPTLEYLLIDQKEYNLPLNNLPKNIKVIISTYNDNCYNEMHCILDDIYKL